MSDFETLFADEYKPSRPKPKENWKVMIVDDEEDIHSVTKLALADFYFADKGLNFIDAYSGEEAVHLFAENRDICLILLDVVMESPNAGLEVVKQIRDEFGDEIVRIILRTGHPGMTPELSVVRSYDISDYKTKSELTAQKLSAALLTSLKTHRLLTTLERKQQALETLNNMLKEQSAVILDKKMMIEAIINHSSNQAILATDKQQFIRYYNTQAADFFTTSAPDAIGMELTEFLNQQGIKATELTGALTLVDNDQISIINLTNSSNSKLSSPFTLSATVDKAGIRLGLILISTKQQLATAGSPRLASPSVNRQAKKKAITIPGFIGNHPCMQQVFSLVHDLANCAAPVLIQGESGTGKELVAASIHNLSQLRDKIYLPINCGAMSEHLLESELFGHEKGAFTGATKTRKGNEH